MIEMSNTCIFTHRTYIRKNALPVAHHGRTLRFASACQRLGSALCSAVETTLSYVGSSAQMA